MMLIQAVESIHRCMGDNILPKKKKKPSTQAQAQITTLHLKQELAQQHIDGNMWLYQTQLALFQSQILITRATNNVKIFYCLVPNEIKLVTAGARTGNKAQSATHVIKS